MIDLLVAFLFYSNPEEQKLYIWRILRVAYGLGQIPSRKEQSVKLKRKFQNELTRHGVRWMKSKSKFVSHTARMGKFWSQTVLFVGCGSGKSFLIELIAAASALEVEESEKCLFVCLYDTLFTNRIIDITNAKCTVYKGNKGVVEYRREE